MARRQWNGRLPILTHRQIKALARMHGLSESQVVTIAVDRFAQESERGGSWERAEVEERVAEIAQND